MEGKTKTILGVAIVAAAAMQLFPPEKGGGYGFIADIDEGVDVWRLLLQLGALGCLSVMAAVVSIRGVRIVGKIMVGAAFLAVAFGVFIYFTQEYPKKQIQMTVQYDPERCSEEFPLLVEVFNKSNRQVSKVYFHFAAYEPGRSTNLFSSNHQATFDWIVGPGLTMAKCWSMSDDGVLEILYDAKDISFSAINKVIVLK